MKKVLITRPVPEAGIALLREKFAVTVSDPPMEPDRLRAVIPEYDALLSMLSDPIDAALLARAEKLKIVANYAVGYNNIDVASAKKHRIWVSHTPEVLTNATAEIAFALLICLTRRILEADRFTRNGRFKGWDPLLFLGDELCGRTLGIIGMGRIGRDMAAKCRAFGLEIVYYQRHPLSPEAEATLGARYLSLDALLAEADAISLHTPLSDATHHLINADAFSRMKDGVYLINTGRGPVVDEAALVAALRSGKVKGAGLDVYEFEPAISSELLAMPNLVLLPHIGSATRETREQMALLAALSIADGLAGTPPVNLIPEMRA